MSNDHPEIIIIKRNKPHEEEHHGGAWKIAFADFMTAMMAFFLVLWIINATDKNTKTIIARYFNPVRLENPAKAMKGVHGAEDSASKSETESDSKKPESSASEKSEAAPPGKPNEGKHEKGAKSPPDSNRSGDPASPNSTMSEAQLFKEPYASLDRIVADSEVGSDIHSAEGFRDPFQAAAPAGAPDASDQSAVKLNSEKLETSLDPPRAKPDLGPGATDRHVAQPAGAPNHEGQLAAAAAQLRKDLMQTTSIAPPSKLGPAIDVKATKEGLLISLTDQWNFSMFAIGSAEPQAQVVKAMNAIAKLLKDRPGEIVVRGHTDGRPYKSAVYDNWRLSSARAQMAYYMLTRGGLPKNRFVRIEGYGDRHLKDQAHPYDARNRYIEILLRESEP